MNDPINECPHPTINKLGTMTYFIESIHFMLGGRTVLQTKMHAKIIDNEGCKNDVSAIVMLQTFMWQGVFYLCFAVSPVKLINKIPFREISGNTKHIYNKERKALEISCFRSTILAAVKECSSTTLIRELRSLDLTINACVYLINFIFG